MSASAAESARAKRPYISAVQRLWEMPALFMGVDLTLRQGWTSKQASHYLWLWTRKGLVQPLGGHSDVYANLLVQRQPDWDAALLMAMPSAVRIDVDCLRQSGWTTQIPARPDVAVLSRGPRHDVQPFTVHPMPAGWFRTVHAGIERPAHPAVALPRLQPAWALADMVARAQDRPGSWLITPDDLDFDAVTARDEAQWAQAIAAFGLEPAPLTLEGYISLYRRTQTQTQGRQRPAGRAGAAP